MPIPNEYREVVNLLSDKTDDGLVHWRSEKFDVSVVFEGSRFALWAGNDENSEEPFVAFALQDLSGTTLDSWYVEGHEGIDYTRMHNFYKSAKRHALGLPDKLRKLRESLASAKEIGLPKPGKGEA
jgi:hypothetical protein